MTRSAYPTDQEVKDIANHYDINQSGFVTPDTEHSGSVRATIVQKLRDGFCGYLRPCMRFNRRISSYGLKHIAEHFIGEYVSNGELIAAMIATHHRARKDNHINAEFAITMPSVRSVAQEAMIRRGWDCHVGMYAGDDYLGKLSRQLERPTEYERRTMFTTVAKKQYIPLMRYY